MFAEENKMRTKIIIIVIIIIIFTNEHHYSGMSEKSLRGLHNEKKNIF